MHRFEVWAPNRRRVDVVVDGRRVAMSPREAGWWAVVDPDAHAGSCYGYSLDGGPPRPDPRSMLQPDGVLGLSEVIDHSAYRWSDQRWRGLPLPGLVLYELHVGTFSTEGTFEGAIAHLQDLVELGVTAVEVMPVAEFSGNRGWGYDGVDLYAPHHAYGGPAGLKTLVDACHARGLAVVLDVVYNHLGPVGNFLAEFGPYFSDRHQTMWGAAVNFDGAGRGEVRRFVVDNAMMWIRDYHIDGLRLDAVHAIADRSPAHILQEIAEAVHATGEALHRSTFVIVESAANDPALVRDCQAGGYGLDAVWSDDWHHALHTVLTGEHEGYYAAFGSFELLRLALRQAWVRRGSPHGLSPDRFVVATQNHDQVGNRATGTRLAALVGEGRLRIAAALLLTSPFTPMLFQGEEWAATSRFLYFTDHADAGVAHAVSTGRRNEFREFGWKPEDVPDPQDVVTFERSKLHRDELARSPHREMRDWHRALLDLRRTLPQPHGTAGEEVEVDADSDLRRLYFRRPGVAVRANLGESDWTSQVAAGESLFLRWPDAAERDVGTVTLPPDGVAVFTTNAGS